MVTETVTYDKEGRIERFPIFKKLFLPLTIILVAGLSFGIGRLSVVERRGDIKIEYDESLSTKFEASNPKQTNAKIETKSQTASVIQAASAQASASQVVASKNGSKYHYLYCGGAKQIKEKNKITFATPAAAEAAGYTLAANCKPR